MKLKGQDWAYEELMSQLEEIIMGRNMGCQMQNNLTLILHRKIFLREGMGAYIWNDNSGDAAVANVDTKILLLQQQQ